MMPFKTATFVFFILKTYFVIGLVYFLVLLYRFNQSINPQIGVDDLIPLAAQALLWPKDLWFYYSQGKI